MLKEMSYNSGRTFKSVQRRREKLRKLSKLQIAVIRKYTRKFIDVVSDRKIYNLVHENISIIKTDNSDIPEEEKEFINSVIKNFTLKDLKVSEIEKEKRTRGRPSRYKSMEKQENRSKMNIYSIFDKRIIEKLQKYLMQKKKRYTQMKFKKKQRSLDNMSILTKSPFMKKNSNFLKAIQSDLDQFQSFFEKQCSNILISNENDNSKITSFFNTPNSKKQSLKKKPPFFLSGKLSIPKLEKLKNRKRTKAIKPESRSYEKKQKFKNDLGSCFFED